jgi:hypothetical protein
VNVAVGVGVNVAVAVGVKVAVGVGVKVAVAVGVGVNVAVAVGVGDGVGWTTVKVTTLVAVQLPSFAVSVTEVVPSAVGVPEITPDPVFTVNPAGNGFAPYLVGLPLFTVI